MILTFSPVRHSQGFIKLCLKWATRFSPASLSGRLLLASFVVLPIFVLISAKALDNAFEKSQMTAERDRLQTHIYLLLGAAELYGNDIWLPDNLQEPRFNQPQSGLYARVYNRRDLFWESRSTIGQPLPSPTANPLNPGQKFIEAIALPSESRNGNTIPALRFTFDVSWENEAGLEKSFRFELFHEQTAMLAERSEYRRQLLKGLVILILLLIVLQWAIQYWGLRPLCRLAHDLESVESGAAETLPEDYPQEIRPVTTNLNRVLAAERGQRDRYRNSLADLAHSLKTPLAVMRGSLESQEIIATHTEKNDGDRLGLCDRQGLCDKQVLNDQLSRMDEIVQHQLHRARVQQVGMPGKAISISASVTRLSGALTKVYRHKDVSFDVHIPSTAYFLGEEGDLMEVLGNLLENACKYGCRQVRVSANTKCDGVQITIEDDGEGIDECARNTVLQRGARADTATAGQGIGLAVVTEILSSYSGSLHIEDAALGGAALVIFLPRRFTRSR